MKRSLCGRLRLQLACLVALLTGPLWSQAQDPFQRPPADVAASSKTAKNSASTGEAERVFKTDEEWKKQLTADQYMVTRMKATERPFTGKYYHGHFKGVFVCVCCDARLFDASHKFDSGTGWPSFYRPVDTQALDNSWDYSEAEPRVEVTCRRCGAHLGHVFEDGPAPTGLRFCINSVAIKLNEEKPAAKSSQKSSKTRAGSRVASRKNSSSSSSKESPGTDQGTVPSSPDERRPPGAR